MLNDSSIVRSFILPNISFLNEVIRGNPKATWEELYILARTRMPDLSIADVETYLKSKGFSKTKTAAAKTSSNPFAK